MSMKKFFVGIKGVIINGDKVLLMRTNQKLEGRDHWEVPGGRIDDDETIEEALTRELREELPNIQNVKIGEILGADRVQKNVDGDTSLVLIFFKVTADFDGEPKLSDEHLEHKWVTHAEAEQLAFPAVADAIRKAFAKD